MPNGQLAERVDTLEYYMKDLSYQALRTERELALLSTEMREFKNEMRDFKDGMIDFKDGMIDFKNEMREFKDEMLDFKNEMLDFKNEMRDFKNEMREFKNEMREFKNEMRDFKDEMLEFKNEMSGFKDEMGGFKNEMSGFKTRAEQDRWDMNRKWGELANKMGSMVEDLVAPSLPRVAKELFACEEPELFTVRMRRRKGPRTIELDALLVCTGVVLINETKSTLDSRDVESMSAKLEAFDEYFPEYSGRRCKGIIASLYVDSSVVAYASSRKILVMGMGKEAMQVLNPEVATD